MEYNFQNIEKEVKKYWKENQVYKVSNDSTKPKTYVLDMFPYPSGAGLHVGHPLGYIASDIYSRYKKMKGFNVLHPMGFDAFGLPAEQYALETGQHPKVTTENNIARYKEQLDNIGFCYDWDRELRTSDAKYYKWTQWIFLQLFKSWFNRKTQKAEPLTSLIETFEKEGNSNHPAPGKETISFSHEEWKNKTDEEKRAILMNYRLAYLDYAEVWWCEALGTVLANDEVVNGVSERGGHPVEKKRMRQWFLRITEFAGRLIESLNHLEWSDAMKEMQRNWIGKSEGAEITFSNAQNPDQKIVVFSTRPDTIFGVDFMVLAPEHPLVAPLTNAVQKEEVEKYIAYVKSRSERERMAEKKITGCFTGSYVNHPFTGKPIPVWISEYVLAGYGTGAVMAVPAGDERDHAFAKHFNIPITNIFGDLYTGEEAITDKNTIIKNSDFITGMRVADAAQAILSKLEAQGIGKRKINFKLRDAGFSRQRYWGEPFPIVYKNNIPYALDEAEVKLPKSLQELPLELPDVAHYKPGPEGEGPLTNISDWLNIKNEDGEMLRRETNTMPGYAGSSWYFLRYMDPNNDTAFAAHSATSYWNQVDLYIGGTEHAVGHLLYSRMWTKVLHDLGYIDFDEPFKKLVNQGMIQGSSRFVYRISGTNKFVSHGLLKDYPEVDKIHVDVNIVYGEELNIPKFKETQNRRYAAAELILENGKYICGSEVEKMSKSKYNVVNPDMIVEQYGADTFRMYEMFLGPIEISKPWDTKGIEGVHRFLKKFWRLYFPEDALAISDEKATAEELKILHQTIKKITGDTEDFSFNTAVSQFMIAVNELSNLQCHKSEILIPLLKLIAPYAPHIAEHIWQQSGHQSSVTSADYPEFNPELIKENSKIYPIAINGKTRTQIEFPLTITQEEVEKVVLQNETVLKWLEGKQPKKIIYVKGRMINLVI